MSSQALHIVTEPVIAPTSDCKAYVVVKGFRYNGTFVHQGFIFDGASVPRFFWRFVPPGRPWVLRASCGHDFLYEHGIGTKEEADALFLKTLTYDARKAGVNPRLIRIMGWCVKRFGRGNFA